MNDALSKRSSKLVAERKSRKNSSTAAILVPSQGTYHGSCSVPAKIALLTKRMEGRRYSAVDGFVSSFRELRIALTRKRLSLLMSSYAHRVGFSLGGMALKPTL